jgi:hypothetical protein
MLRQRAFAGINQACQIQLKETSVLVKKNVGSHVEVETLFDTVFYLFILSISKQHEGLHRNHFAMFERAEPAGKENDSGKKKSVSGKCFRLDEVPDIIVFSFPSPRTCRPICHTPQLEILSFCSTTQINCCTVGTATLGPTSGFPTG